jgi:2-iminobutanoate/2-iminopropanoate deaminase
MKVVAAPDAAQPLGHYSQAVSDGRTLYLSTQLGIDPADPAAPPASVARQTANILASVRAILRAGGSDLEHVLKVTIYLSDIAHWEEVNRAYAAAFGDHRPARGVIPVGKLHHGYDVAFDVIAEIVEHD